MAGFLDEIKGVQGQMTTALQHQEERLTMLDRKTMTYARPALSAHAEGHQTTLGPYHRAWH